MPDGYEYKKLSRSEYEKALHALFGLRADEQPRGEIGRVIAQALQRYDIEGWSINLPYAMEATAGRTATAWGTQYKGALEQHGIDVEKAQRQYYGDYLAYLRETRQQQQFGAQQQWQQYGAEMDRWRMQTQAQQQLWQNERARQGALGEQYGMQAQRWGALTQGIGSEQAAIRNSEKQRIWESARQEMLSAIGDEPQDWIKRWQIENKPNPYSAKPNIEQAWEDVEAQRAQVKRWESMEKDVQKQFKDTKSPLWDDPDAPTSPEQWRSHMILRGAKAARDQLLEMEETLAEEQISAGKGGPLSKYFPESGGTPYETTYVPTDTTAPTPDWLKKLYPTMGARLPEKGEIGTEFAPMPLSAQWMQRALPSELAGYGGYVEYAGGDIEDILWQSQQMFPRQKAGPRWGAARQRTSV